VDSRKDSPRITDYDLFHDIVAGIVARPAVEMIGITGGEPFIERRGLSYAVQEFSSTGKCVAIFTSGVWARESSVPQWVTDLLPEVSCILLSMDAFHARTVNDQQFITAARAVVEANVPLIIQVLDESEHLDQLAKLCASAFGPSWRDIVELSLINGVPWGRGSTYFDLPPKEVASGLSSKCTIVSAPIIRYDGRVSACCNEAVIMGRGADRLRLRVQSRSELVQALDDIGNDPLLRAVAAVPTGILTLHPRYANLANTEVRGMCDACWRMQSQTESPIGKDSDNLLTAMSLVAGQS